MKGKSPQWQWSNKMLEDIIVCLKEYKSEMDYKDVDFNVDVAALYSYYTRFVLCTYESEWLSSLTRSILASVCHFMKTVENKLSARLPTERKYKLTGWINPPRMRGTRAHVNVKVFQPLVVN